MSLASTVVDWLPQIGLASVVVEWLLQIDLSCVVCQWDPERGWVPYAAGATGSGLGAYPGLSDLLDDMLHPPPTVGAPGGTTPYPPTVDPRWTPPQVFHSTHVENTGPAIPPGLQDMSPEERGEAEEREQERLRDQFRENNRDATTAGPPEPTTGEVIKDAVGDWVYRNFFTLGTRDRE